MNGKSAAHGDAIPALRYSCFLLAMRVEDRPCSPHPFLQQNGHHGILRKFPQLKVTLFHECGIFLLIISKV